MKKIRVKERAFPVNTTEGTFLPLPVRERYTGNRKSARHGGNSEAYSGNSEKTGTACPERNTRRNTVAIKSAQYGGNSRTNSRKRSVGQKREVRRPEERAFREGVQAGEGISGRTKSAQNGGKENDLAAPIRIFMISCTFCLNGYASPKNRIYTDFLFAGTPPFRALFV